MFTIYSYHYKSMLFVSESDGSYIHAHIYLQSLCIFPILYVKVKCLTSRVMRGSIYISYSYLQD